MYEAERKKKKRARKRRLHKKRFLAFIAVLCIIVFSIGYGVKMAYSIYLEKQTAKEVQNSEYTGSSVQKYATIPIRQEGLDRPIYILVLGIEKKQNNAIEGAFLLSVNEMSHTVDIIGIPVDSKMLSRDGKTKMPFKAMYALGGLDLMRAAAEDIFKVPIPYFVVFNEFSFQKIASTTGVPNMFIERSMQQYDEDGMDISLVKGYQKMDATKAWAYIRFQDANDGGISQLQRQERLIKALAGKMHDTSLLASWYDTYKYWDDLDTNISTWDALKLTKIMRAIPIESYKYYILPGAKEEIDKNIYWDINPEETQRIIGITMNFNGGENAK